jgi:hypothetical protein
MPIITADKFRQLSEQAREMAEQMNDPSSRHAMMGIALSYDRLALRALIRDTLMPETKRIGTPRHDDRAA